MMDTNGIAQFAETMKASKRKALKDDPELAAHCKARLGTPWLDVAARLEAKRNALVGCGLVRAGAEENE